MSIDSVLVDGYGVGERLLEGVMFKIEIEEMPGSLTIIDITPAPSAYPYIKSIRWEIFVPALRASIQSNIDHLMKCSSKEGHTINEELNNFAAQTGLARLELLNEV